MESLPIAIESDSKSHEDDTAALDAIESPLAPPEVTASLPPCLQSGQAFACASHTEDLVFRSLSLWDDATVDEPAAAHRTAFDSQDYLFAHSVIVAARSPVLRARIEAAQLEASARVPSSRPLLVVTLEASTSLPLFKCLLE